MARMSVGGWLAAGLAFALLIGLGVWQLERLAWKEAAIARIAARAQAAPQPLPPRDQWAALLAQDYDYRRVSLHGRFLPVRPARVFRASAPGGPPGEGPGYVLIAPFETAQGPVLVNRGFVPLARIEAAASPPQGERELVGLMRPPEPRNAFTPADRPDKDVWYTRDGPAIAAFMGLIDAAPFTVDLERAPGIDAPRGGVTEMAIPNNHLSYALTWFGLAGALAVVFALFARRRRM